MNWMNRPLGRRLRAPELKESRTGPMIALTGAGRPRWTPRDYASLATEGFARNAVAYRCVRMIAEAAASAPLAVFVDGVREDDHPAARLPRKPNPAQGSRRLVVPCASRSAGWGSERDADGMGTRHEADPADGVRLCGD